MFKITITPASCPFNSRQKKRKKTAFEIKTTKKIKIQIKMTTSDTCYSSSLTNAASMHRTAPGSAGNNQKHRCCSLQLFLS